MRARIKIRILACLAIMIGAICAMFGCVSRKEQDRRNEELVAAYPEEVKAYLEEKYGREFCVSSEREAGEGSPIPFAESYLHMIILHGRMRRMDMLFGHPCIQCLWMTIE